MLVATLAETDSGEKAGFSLIIALAIIGLVVVAGSVWADYKWRKWMGERRRERQ
jgi:hypothetical protein